MKREENRNIYPMELLTGNYEAGSVAKEMLGLPWSSWPPAISNNMDAQCAAVNVSLISIITGQ